jgi:hypothetical protein
MGLRWEIYVPANLSVLNSHHPIHPALIYIRLIFREHKISPATKESYRVYIGTSSLKADMYAY